MALMYLKTSLFGTAVAYSNDDELCATAAVVMLGCKRRSGGSVPGHQTCKRSRFASDWTLNQEYFVDRALYSDDVFRRRYMLETI
jgi:hypothetical protein